MKTVRRKILWNADTVKELFEQLNNTWMDRTGEALNVEYKECYGNFLYFIERGSDDNKVVYISDLANNKDILDDIARMKFIYCFFIIKHTFEVGRFIQCKNPSGLVEFLERISKYICEQCGYSFFTLEAVQEAIKEITIKYPVQVLKEHEDTAVITLLSNDERYKVSEISGDKISLSSISSDDMIMLDDLKTDTGSFSCFTISF